MPVTGGLKLKGLCYNHCN